MGESDFRESDFGESDFGESDSEESDIEIRDEGVADGPPIEAVTVAAVLSAVHTSHTEQFIVSGLHNRTAHPCAYCVRRSKRSVRAPDASKLKW